MTRDRSFTRCLGVVLGRASPPPLPFDPASLGGGRADAVLTAAGFVQPAAGHNATGELCLSLGAARSDEAWQVALLPFMGALATLAEKQGPHAVTELCVQANKQGPHAAVFARARDAFEAEVARGVDVSVDAATGQVVLAPMRFRLLSVVKSSDESGRK